MNPIEAVAVAFGVACVALTIRQSLWCWPTGLVQVVLYIFVFYSARLYSDMLLHVIYVGLQLYGWYHWVHGARRFGDSLPVTRLTPPLLVAIVAGTIVTAWIWGTLMVRYTDAAAAHLDAFIAAASLAAQYLLARKKLESWLLWMTVDVVAIGVFWSRGLTLTAGLYAVFLALSVLGFFEWHRSYRRRGALIPAGANGAA